MDAKKWIWKEQTDTPTFVSYNWNQIYTHAFDFQNHNNKLNLNDNFNENKKIIPIIFSHGLTACRAFYSSLCIELASFGFMVFALDHHDGSCCYTEDETGSKIWNFDSNAPYF